MRGWVNRGPAPGPRRWSTWPRSGTTSRCCWPPTAPGARADDRGQGRRLRARRAAGGAGRAGRRCVLARGLHPRGGARAAGRRHRRAGAVLAAPARRGLRTGHPGRRRPGRVVPRAPGRGAGRGACGRPPGPAAPEDRHRADPQRRRRPPTGTVCSTTRSGPRRTGRPRWSPSGRTWPRPTSRSTRPTTGRPPGSPRRGGRPCERGLHPIRHLANSAATLTRPDLHFDLVRAGIAGYGLDPLGRPVADGVLRPAMTLRARVALVKRVPAGEGVSYGHEWTTPRETTLALLPIGYADGVPRRLADARADAGAAGRGPATGRRPGLHGPDRRGLRRRHRPRGGARRAVRSG